MSKDIELRLLAKIATLYYEEQKNQSQIAKYLNLSQSFVSRAIKRCHAEGLVKVSVIQPSGTFIALEQQLQSKYAISQFVVVDVEDNPSPETLKRVIGSAAASYLQNTLTGKELVGISSWSTFAAAMIETLHPRMAKAHSVVQILGGVGHHRNMQANILTNQIANLLDCPAHYLPSTSQAQTPQDKARKLKDSEVANVVNLFDQIDIAITGVGTSAKADLERNLGVVYNEDTFGKLREKGAVGDICMRYYDHTGAPILSEEEDPIISMSLQQLKNCPRVLALAGGLEKVSALKGAMAGGYIDVLVTDRVTALELMK